mmetsp:Transcript_39526/g.62778  ORF Transcript_39526/g.62778 Transcript_39526/m.62778 type:complete len:154 (+) Transcript_39526:166-627(+)
MHWRLLAWYSILAFSLGAVPAAGVVFAGTLSRSVDSSALASKTLRRRSNAKENLDNLLQRTAREMILNTTLDTGSAKYQPSSLRVNPNADHPYARRDVPPPPPGDPPSSEPKEYLGVSKLVWAVVATVLALLAFVACIPCVLTFAKRRRAAAT